MDNNELINQANHLLTLAKNTQDDGSTSLTGLEAQTAEFLRLYAGSKSSFYHGVSVAPDFTHSHRLKTIISILESFIDFVEQGLLNEISPQRKTQIETVSDFLEQANMLIEANGVHPASPIVITGAALEEFLRTWAESLSLSIGNKKPGLDTYAKILRKDELITKQDIKDITSWSGLRNHAAHGEWDEVSDKKQASLMLAGVNLFMRKYGA
jgi:hypothetical protein